MADENPTGLGMHPLCVLSGIDFVAIEAQR